MGKKAIVTGSSRGLGAALVEQLEADGWDVLGVARSGEPSVDLADPAGLEGWLDSGALAAHVAGAQQVLLVNNAGVLGPEGVAGKQNAREVAGAVHLNVVAPIVLTNAVLQHRPAGVPTRVAHISSGAGRWPIEGWSVYCATKAALDHHAVTVAAERHENLRIAAIRPGVIDTDMQGRMRSTDFPRRDDFVALQQQGQLLTAAESARAVLAIINGPRFGDEVLASV